MDSADAPGSRAASVSMLPAEGTTAVAADTMAAGVAAGFWARASSTASASMPLMRPCQLVEARESAWASASWGF